MEKTEITQWQTQYVRANGRISRITSIGNKFHDKMKKDVVIYSLQYVEFEVNAKNENKKNVIIMYKIYMNHWWLSIAMK